MNPHSTSAFRHAAFSLIELLVVVSIIAVLAALLLPAIKLVREAAYGSSCLSNLRQLHMGVSLYAQDFSVLPPTYGSWPYNRKGWPHVMAATYLESSSQNGQNQRRDVLKCPGDKRIVDTVGVGGFLDTQHYVAAVWSNNSQAEVSDWVAIISSYANNYNAFPGNQEYPPGRSAAPSRMALFWDSHQIFGEWGPLDQNIPGTNRHQRGANIVYGDGRAAHQDFSPLKVGENWWIQAGSSDFIAWGWMHFVGVGSGSGPFDVNQPPWKIP